MGLTEARWTHDWQKALGPSETWNSSWWRHDAEMMWHTPYPFCNAPPTNVSPLPYFFTAFVFVLRKEKQDVEDYCSGECNFNTKNIATTRLRATSRWGGVAIFFFLSASNSCRMQLCWMIFESVSREMGLYGTWQQTKRCCTCGRSLSGPRKSWEKPQKRYIAKFNNVKRVYSNICFWIKPWNKDSRCIL